MYCQSCGKELTAGAAYCASCGAKVGAPVPPAFWWGWRKWEWERKPWRDWEPADPAWGAVRAVGFLIILGMTIVYYPDVFVLFFRYLGSWGSYGYPVLPPRALGEVIIFLFTASGAWGVVSAGLRLVFSNRLRETVRDVVGGLFSLYVAFIFTQFYAGTIHGTGLVLAFFLGLAAMVLVNAVAAHALPRRRRPMRASQE